MLEHCESHSVLAQIFLHVDELLLLGIQDLMGLYSAHLWLLGCHFLDLWRRRRVPLQNFLLNRLQFEIYFCVWLLLRSLLLLSLGDWWSVL